MWIWAWNENRLDQCTTGGCKVGFLFGIHALQPCIDVLVSRRGLRACLTRNCGLVSALKTKADKDDIRDW